MKKRESCSTQKKIPPNSRRRCVRLDESWLLEKYVKYNYSENIRKRQRSQEAALILTEMKSWASIKLFKRIACVPQILTPNLTPGHL